MDARKRFFGEISGVQDEVNELACQQGKRPIDILNQEEKDRIFWHWENNIWPEGWDGMEAIATAPHIHMERDGSYQAELFGPEIFGE